MSIQSEITRLETAKSAIAAAIAGKGVTVPDGTMLDGMAALIEAISAGGGVDFGDFTPYLWSRNIYNDSWTIYIGTVYGAPPEVAGATRYIGIVFIDPSDYEAIVKTAAANRSFAFFAYNMDGTTGATSLYYNISNGKIVSQSATLNGKNFNAKTYVSKGLYHHLFLVPNGA